MKRLNKKAPPKLDSLFETFNKSVSHPSLSILSANSMLFWLGTYLVCVDMKISMLTFSCLRNTTSKFSIIPWSRKISQTDGHGRTDTIHTSLSLTLSVFREHNSPSDNNLQQIIRTIVLLNLQYVWLQCGYMYTTS